MSKHQYTIEQKRAIEFFPTNSAKKHLVIEAGAGSGKTTILKERVKFLLLKKNFLPEDLIVITFTKNSTAELKHRILQIQDENLAEKVNFIHVSTIDSFFASLVESLYPIWWDTHAHLEKTIPAQLSLLDENQALLELEGYFEKAMANFEEVDMREVADFILAGGLEKGSNYQAKRSPLQALLSTMLGDVFLSSNLDNIRISAQTIHPATQKIIEKCYAVARIAYQKRIESGTFTYQDRNVFLKENLHLSCPLFFKELIVDEYQDTNHIQHAILWKLVELNQAQMTVVGDPKQSIYAFRGSNVDVFRSLLNSEQWNVISLDVNFRSNDMLLNEINTLSHLSFDWQTPNMPELFKSSFFHEEAFKKSIGHKALKAGNSGAENTFQPAVTLFEYEAAKNHNKTDAEPSKKREFNENNLKSLGHYLIEQVSQNTFQWKDVAILCEKNKQIAKIKKIFLDLGIPFSSDMHNDTRHEKSFTHTISLSLFNILHEGIHKNSMDLVHVLLSPLTQFSYEQVMSIGDEFQETFQILEHYQEKSKHQFFIAWQNCRFALANLCALKTGKNDALIFCRYMDEFAEKIFSLSQSEPTANIKKILSMPNASNKKPVANEPENAISIKTVHGAKGLEWDVVCFYPATSRYESAEPFSISNSWPFLDVNWLSEDIKSLSFLQKVENSKFQELDYHYDEEKEKNVWFSDLRNQLEKNFERQRIFYTAFTRPRKKLIFVHPERHAANSARKIDKKFKYDAYEKNFEQDVFLKYAYLTQEKRANAEHVKFDPNNAHTTETEKKNCGA